MKTLNNLKPNKGSQYTSKRLGRGNASGKGTYSGKGLKGQKCRAGVSNLKRIGLKSVIFSTPKKRGFNRKNDCEVVYTGDINKAFKDNDVISPEALKKNGLVQRIKNIKVVVNGEFSLSGVKFEGIRASAKAKELVAEKK